MRIKKIMQQDATAACDFKFSCGGGGVTHEFPEFDAAKDSCCM
jgi:hypothetical protein